MLGWSKVFKNKTNLVAEGVYKYVQHSQYTGILLATLGLIIIDFDKSPRRFCQF